MDIHKLSVPDISPYYFPFTPFRVPVSPFQLEGDCQYTPGDFFKLFFDLAIVQLICDSTNKYAEKLKEKQKDAYKSFFQVTPDALYKSQYIDLFWTGSI